MVKALANVEVALTGSDVGIFKSITSYIDIHKGTLSDGLKDKIFAVLNDAMKIAPGSVSVDAIKKEFVDAFGRLGDSVKKSVEILTSADWIGAIRTIVLVVVGVLLPVADVAGKLIAVGLPIVATGVKTLIDAIASAGQGDFGNAAKIIATNLPQVTAVFLALSLINPVPLGLLGSALVKIATIVFPAMAAALPGLAGLITPVALAFGGLDLALSPLIIPIAAVAASIFLIFGYFSGNKDAVKFINDVRDALAKFTSLEEVFKSLGGVIKTAFIDVLVIVGGVVVKVMELLVKMADAVHITAFDQPLKEMQASLAKFSEQGDLNYHDPNAAPQLPYGDGVRAPVAPAVPSTPVPGTPAGGSSGQSIGAQSMAAQSAANTHNTTIQSIVIQQSQKSAKDTFDDIISEARSRGVNLGF